MRGRFRIRNLKYVKDFDLSTGAALHCGACGSSQNSSDAALQYKSGLESAKTA